MQKYFLKYCIFSCLLLLTHPNFAATQAKSTQCTATDDKTFRQIIVGTWVGEEEIAVPGINAVYLGKSIYAKNGDLILQVVDKENPSVVLVTMKGKWEIKNGQLVEAIKTITPKEMDLGVSHSSDKILCMNKKYLQTQGEDKAILQFHKQ